ncbi:hypothetical protein N657DRAFT_622599 [Parathielavia appendiculata]|uniref:DUF1996 domain-containing protein n=1 Tax=Parathielavia appendiculata TaxID=2587402 RepID=A0AAN6TWW3_9PEZI|nr:hypothetical protein N657DRAFT_622599 [Parathielavia appendiculata]
MFWSALLFVALADAQGFMNGLNHLRFGCSQITIERLDPLVEPGRMPTSHMHQVVGGNAFNVTMPTTDIAQVATCTTCGPADDFSNYWTANLYFRAPNGSHKRVPQIPNRFLFNDRFTTQTNGGVTVYYISPGKWKVTAFKPGFRMFVGDVARRTPLYKSQSCFRCFSGPNFGGDDLAPCTDSRRDFEGFPPQPCPGGIRSNILYPTCWDGKNLDSPNHKDHVAYPVSGPSTFLSTGDCPASHPVKIPQLMLEIVWDTTAFNDRALWPATGQPFVLSTGDTTGFGQHGDYIFGWKGDALQRAMDVPNGCFAADCGNQKTQNIESANRCQIAKKVKEEVDGWFDMLPGMAME